MRSFFEVTNVRGDGMKYALAYNAFHNLESIGIEGKDEALIKYAYKNGNGRLKQMTYANGHTMKAVYNSIGQMVAEKWFETEAAAASSNATPIAHYKYVYDGDGNIVRSIDISGKKEYNYEYEEGRIVRATESDITLNGEVVTSKVIVNTVKYYYDTEGKMTKKVITFSDNSTHTVHYENSDDNTVVKFDVPDTENANKKQTITSHSKTDSFGRKVFDELQIGRGFVSRQFSYMPGAITEAHKENRKIKSTATTQLVSHIALSDGRTISYKYDDEERIIKVTDTIDGTVSYTYDALGQLETETHPFQVKGKGWVDACNLNPGDIVYTKDWNTATVNSVNLLELDEPVEVFNFEVEDCHTYFVGSNYILVHNTCPKKDYYRGGSDFSAKPSEVRMNNNGMVKTTHGVSVNTNPNAVASHGTPHKIVDLPKGLDIIQRGVNPSHYEIVPSQPMPFSQYQDLLSQIISIAFGG